MQRCNRGYEHSSFYVLRHYSLFRETGRARTRHEPGLRPHAHVFANAEHADAEAGPWLPRLGGSHLAAAAQDEAVHGLLQAF